MIGQLEPLFVRGLIHLLALVILDLEHSRQTQAEAVCPVINLRFTTTVFTCAHAHMDMIVHLFAKCWTCCSH